MKRLEVEDGCNKGVGGSGERENPAWQRVSCQDQREIEEWLQALLFETGNADRVRMNSEL